MAVQVNPITQSLPATTAIQDPATRRFAQAVEDALRALRSEEGAVESLKKAADAMNGAIAGGTPPSIAQWLFSSELYQKLTTEIARIDVEAKQNLLDEALARQTAIDEINATLATIQSTAAYDPLVTYAVGDMVTYDGKLYQAILETTGNLPTNTTYWKKVGDYATLGDVVAAHTLKINDLESRVTTDEGNLTAEIANRQALATQVRGSYTGTDVNLVSQGLIYSERVARSTADSTEVAKRESLSAKILGATDPDGLTLNTLSEGLIFDERQARVSGDGANASSISALRAQVGVTEAGALTTGLILDEKNVRASNDLAIVSAVNTALARITGVSTSISQSGENLIANWSQAQATKWSQIESEVLTSGGQTIRAALLQESQTRANLEGDVYASYTLRVDANGNIAGFGLAADENSSEFIIRADKFALVTNVGGTPYVPFAIGNFGPMLLDSGGFNVSVNALVSASANPTSFLESFQSGDLTQWTNHGGSGELSVVSVSDSLTGGKVLRIGNNSGNDQAWLIHKQNIPFDPSALYRIKFRVRRTAGTGTVYLGVAGVAADGTTWVRANGANSINGQHYVAANGQNPGTAWTEYVGYVKGTAATGQSGTNPPVTVPLKLHQNVRYIRPLIVANYDDVAGITEVDYCSIELMTDAMNWDDVLGTGKDTLVTTASTALTNANNAQTSANAANSALADIAADNKLTPAEKKSVRKEWDAIYAERAGIRAQADSFGITTEKTNYDNDFQALGTYLNGGTAYTIGSTPPSWITDANLATTTTIVGTTFRANWKNLYADRQALLNKISAEAAKRANWALTNGKPDDEDILNAGHPLNKNPDLLGAVANAETAPSWQRVVVSTPAFAGIRIEAAGSSYGPPWDREAPMFYATIADTANAPNEQAYWVSDVFKIDTSKPHCLSGWARKMWGGGAPRVYFRVRCYDKDSVSLGFISHYSGYAGLTTTWEQMVKTIEPADWPAGTYKVRIEWYGAYKQYGSSVATRLMLNEGRVPTKNLAPPVVDIDAHLTRNGTSVLAADFVATWNKITSSNVLNYMGPTAITAAVIGTAAIETAKIKDGAITTAKIGDLEVDTIKLADQAVTIPSGAYTASATALSTTYKTVQTVTYTSSGAPVIIICSCVVGAGSLVGVNARITRNGVALYDAWTISVGQSAGAYTSCVVTIRDTLTTPGPRTYNFDISYQSFASGDATARSMVVLEVKK